jgi:hypothetical protein
MKEIYSGTATCMNAKQPPGRDSLFAGRATRPMNWNGHFVKMAGTFRNRTAEWRSANGPVFGFQVA